MVNRPIRLAGGLCLLAALVASCGKAPAAAPADGGRLVVDMAGNTVRVPENIRSIGCLEVLCYEKLFLLGASERVVMMIRTNAPWMQQTNPRLKDIQQLASEPGSEELLRQHVDLVFRTFGYPDPAKIEQLAKMGVPVLVSQTMGRDRIDSIEAFVESRKRMLRVFGQALGPSYLARAEEWCAYHDRMVTYVRARTDNVPPEKRLRLFHVRGPAANHTSGLASHPYWYAVIAGADMVIKNRPMAGKGDVSMEEILKWDPEVVNIGRQYSAELVTKDPRWATVSAVRHGRVRELPEGVFYWDGSTEGVLYMLYVAKELYPERFADLDLKKEFSDYYARFYRYALSDREVDLMLQGKGPDGRRRNDMNN